MQAYTNEDDNFQQQQLHQQQMQQKYGFQSEKIAQTLITDLKQTQNPFSFYHSQSNNRYQRYHSNPSYHNTDQQDQTPLQDITGQSSTHKVHKVQSQLFYKYQFNQIATPKKNLEFGILEFQQFNSLKNNTKDILQNHIQSNNMIETSQNLSNFVDFQSNFFQKEKLANMLTQDQQLNLNHEDINLQAVSFDNNIVSQISDIVISQDTTSKNCNPSSCKVSLQIIGSQKQLDDDMNQIKLNLKNKKRVSNKQAQKIDTPINKTMFTTPVKSLSKKQTTNINNSLAQPQIKQDTKMIYKLMGSKKKQNFNALIQWNNKKNNSLTLHKEMVQHFLLQIDKRLKSSKQNFDIYCQFFKQKASQQQKYANTSLIDTKFALKNNDVSKSLFINCTIIMNSLNQQLILKNKKIKDFVLLIRQNIIKELMEKHLSQSLKSLLVLRQKISTIKKTLIKYNQQVQITNQQLLKIFNQYSTPKDFYAIQIKYLRRSLRQSTVQKKLGTLSLQFYQKAIEQDIKRSQIIRQALITYSKGLKQTYNLDMQKEQMEQLSKGEQKKLILQFYSFQQMFQDKMIKNFKKRCQIGFKKEDQITFQHFQKYLQYYKIQNFDDRMAILKDFNITYKSKDSKNEQNCYLVITVDGFLHFFINKDKKMLYSDPDITLPIFKKCIHLKNLNGESLQIIKKEDKKSSVISYFWDSSKNDLSYLLIFFKKDAKQEFIDIINKLIK